MQHIEQIVWKPSVALPGANEPDPSTAGGLRPLKLRVALGNGRTLVVRTARGDAGVTITVLDPGGRATVRLSIATDLLPDLADALLYAHRRAQDGETAANIRPRGPQERGA